MQEKLQVLQSKLTDEEGEKGQLMKKVKEADERLKQSDERLRSEQEKSSELAAKVAKLSQALSTTQEAVKKEQKTVELLADAAQPTSAMSELMSATASMAGSTKVSSPMNNISKQTGEGFNYKTKQEPNVPLNWPCIVIHIKRTLLN